MNISLLERGDINLYIESLELEYLVEDVVLRFLENSNYRDRSIRARIAPGLSCVKGDSTRLSEILDHLVDNALRFSEDDDEVVVRLDTGEEGCVRVTVVDQGPGIPESAWASIFVSFRQADTSHTRHHDGLGLGLTLAAGLVNLHGSRLEFVTVEGAGTSFFFELPSTSESSEA